VTVQRRFQRGGFVGGEVVDALDEYQIVAVRGQQHRIRREDVIGAGVDAGTECGKRGDRRVGGRAECVDQRGCYPGGMDIRRRGELRE
jgi:hypothetical protein